MKRPAPWDELSHTLRASTAYRALSVATGSAPVRAMGLPVAAAAWVGELRGEDVGRPLVVVVPRESDAALWVEASELVGGSSVYFSAPALTPYQETEISLGVRAGEAAALDRLLDDRTSSVVCTPRALFRRLPTPQAFRRAVMILGEGEEHPIEELSASLVRRGYHRVDLVSEVGEFAVRGGVFDLFPPGPEGPLRLDLFGDTIDSLSRFDPVSQRSTDPLEAVRVLPLTLFDMDGTVALELADRLAAELGEEIDPDAAARLERLRRTGSFPGWENYLPLIAPATVALQDWLPGAEVVLLDPEDLAAEVAHHEERLELDFRSRREHRRIAAEPHLLEQPAAAVRDVLASAELAVGDLYADPQAGAIDFGGSATEVLNGQIARFPREVETARARGERLVLVAPTEHRERWHDLARSYELDLGRGGVELVAGELGRGFRLPACELVVFGEPQIFPRMAPRRRGRKVWAPFVSGLRDLKVGDYVVHDDHGIGQLVSLRTVEDEGAPDPTAEDPWADESPAAEKVEVMEIEYKGGRRLLLPLTAMGKVQKYGGIEGTAPKLDDLGGSSWNRTKSRVRKGMKKLAFDLLELYAQRQTATAPAMPPDSDLQAQFEAAFEYEETADQLSAVEAIKADLEQTRPMDRLLCGDVGFGKTEVAMRAAHKVVEGGFQVALLAPTTILADQHLETFNRRFAGSPVRIDMISRFRSAREVKELRERAATGQIDILIGTHRLLGRDVALPRLGLLIVDEEQRFGVAQKERLKRLKTNVHVLAMSATPVPRTLQLSLAGVRDLSVIETAPRDRLAVETAIMPWSEELVREAIEAEVGRGGQVFYVYNRVSTIERLSGMLRELLPDLRITVGHGQLPEKELEQRIHAFKEHEYDVLLATTIIENGIDMPNVNTIIVHRADHFGLAQLYQLRGRVGRSDRLAYCYLLVPGDRVLTEEGRQRLAAIREFTELGAGFRIAARDLEIRGAGNLLGARQSGHIVAVGMETYLKMLEDCVRELRGETVDERPSTAIDLPVSMAIPEDYVRDVNLRMEIYRRAAAEDESREELLEELRDRFGPPPAAVHQLLEVAALQKLAERLGVQSIAARSGKLSIRLRQDAQVDVERLIEMVSLRPGLSFSPTGVLTIDVAPGSTMVGTAFASLSELDR